jgi:hypothetical protein
MMMMMMEDALIKERENQNQLSSGKYRVEEKR